MVHSYLNHKGAIAVAFSIPERGRDTSRFTCAPLSSYQSSGQQHSWNVPEEDVVPLSAYSTPPPSPTPFYHTTALLLQAAPVLAHWSQNLKQTLSKISSRYPFAWQRTQAKVWAPKMLGWGGAPPEVLIHSLSAAKENTGENFSQHRTGGLSFPGSGNSNHTQTSIFRITFINTKHNHRRQVHWTPRFCNTSILLDNTTS